jgi:hypothetical protein
LPELVLLRNRELSYNEDKNSENSNAEMGTGKLQGKDVNGKQYQE